MVQEKAPELIHAFLEVWSENVDPSASSMPHTFMEHLAKTQSMVVKPQTRLAIAMAMYTEEGAQTRTPPSPSVCGLVTTGDLSSFEKTPFVSEIMEKTLDRLQSEWRPIMEKHTSQCHWDCLLYTSPSPRDS